jgi:hypothetical protein
MSANQGPSATDLIAAVQRGGLTEALKLVLVQKSTGAKRERSLGGQATNPPKPHSAPTVSSKASHLSPGEVPRSGDDVWVLLAVIAALCVYYFVR